ncbi:OpgC domain-containing protein [Motilimonas eburnea]|uniref:OpgC domain-containing protein n=1 Tax=Motilimonas eburnea TaxID=1737488 RepID=UPI001E45F829|nr:OpgC domain-containing protein [Motilimonas eburnea]MCE2569868.1 OpgC domain-containing protein [Motilimonas eburnea]
MNRIDGLDTLRGLFLVLMMINHLVWNSGGQTVLQLVSLQPLGQVGAAEGFIFISGLLAGFIYTNQKYTPSQLTRKAISRAFTLYYYHLICLVLVLMVAWISITINPGMRDFYLFIMPNFINAPEHAAWLSALLLNRPAYFDILPMYTLFMLLLPLMLLMLRKGFGPVLLLLSLLLWLASGWINQADLAPLFNAISPDLAIRVGYFDPFAWQLIFVVGVCIGFYRRQGRINWYRYPSLVWLALVLCASMFLVHHGALLDLGIHQGVLYALADKPELGWLRLVNLLLLAYLFGYIIKRWPHALNMAGLSLLGRHSLQVFAWHTVVIFIATPFLFAIKQTPYYSLAILAITCSLFIPALIHQGWQQRAQRRIVHHPIRA